MLSSVLNSERAVQVNIHTIRVFTRIRQLLLTNKEVLLKLEKLERMVVDHDGDIMLIFKYLKELLNPRLNRYARLDSNVKKMSSFRGNTFYVEQAF